MKKKSEISDYLTIVKSGDSTKLTVLGQVNQWQENSERLSLS